MAWKTLFFIFCCAAASTFAEGPIKKTLHVPMRDGIMLPTDIYLPHENASQLPCILIRSPAGCEQLMALNYTFLAQHGYAVAIQATRSYLDTEGKTIPYRSDGWHTQQDGYDSVEWLARYPLTNGKIGTVGTSAQGITQLLMAPTAPPSLKCQHISFAAPTLRDHAIFPNGKLLKNQVQAWLGYYARDTGIFAFVSSQQFFDPFWEEFDSLKVVDRVQTPAILQGGWYDIFIQGTLDAFVARQEQGGNGARGKQKLIVGPWMHFWPIQTNLGEFDVPEAGRQAPIDTSPLRWFDHYLKDLPNGAEDIPAITYYVMGPFDGSPSSGNVWRHADKWPIPAVEKTLFLAGSTLNENLPIGLLDAKEFHHDPSQPVPTIGGHNLFIASGPMDQRSIESRNDVLLFTTPPLQEDLEVTGRIKARLHVSSDCCDTDFALRLTDVYPDGRSILITDGVHRTGLTATQEGNLQIGDTQEIEVDLGTTSIVFAKGHRIRLSICGSNFPRYEINRNVGLLGHHSQTNVVARNKVLMGEATPSRLILPIPKNLDK